MVVMVMVVVVVTDNVASLLPQKIIYKKHASYVITVAGGISDNNITMIFLTRGLTSSAAWQSFEQHRCHQPSTGEQQFQVIHP